MSRLTLALFGTFDVKCDGQPITRFALDSARALLAYLVLNPGPQRRETIAALFWEDRATDSALKQLRMTLNKLREALGQASDEFIRSDTRALEFNLNSEFTLDTAQFDALVSEVAGHKHRRLRGCAVCLEKQKRAVELYRGELLAGLTLDSQPYEEWLRGERERYHRQALEALYELGEAALEHGEWREAEHYARRQLKLEPWHEEAHDQLILTCAARNQRTAALAQYRECVSVLERELGATPSARTLELGAQLQSGDPLPAADLPNFRFPHAAFPPLIGRETEIARLTERLVAASTRLVSVVGMGGMGKTRLAEAVAAQVRYSFEQGVVFVPLGEAAADATREGLLDAIARAVEVRRDARALDTQLLDVLSDRDQLLVLDNLEPWLAQEGQATRAFLGKLLARAPRVVLLVTSREAVGMQAEYKWVLEGLAVPPSQTEARALRDYPSVQLFVDYAERSAAPMQWDEAALQDVAQLCTLVNGSPLALELAASWMNRATLVEITSNLVSGLDTLATHFSDIPARHRSMRAVFEQSWSYLPDQAQALFARLGIFRGGFTREAVVQITQLPDASALLDLVRERSLVSRDANGRYGMHELLRQYALEKAQALVPPALLAHRHSNYYLALLNTHADALRRRSVVAMAELRPELENIRFAWQTALSMDTWEPIDATLESIAKFFNRLGLLAESVHLIGEALTRAEIAQPGERFAARLHAQYANCLNWVARYPEAIEHARQASDYAVRVDDPLLLAESENASGYALVYTTAYVQAERHLAAARAAAQRAGDLQKEADALRHSIQIYYRLGRWELDEETGTRALELYRRVNDTLGQGLVLGDMALSQMEQAHTERAMELFDQAEQAVATSGDLSLQATIESRHAILLSHLGNYGQAVPKFLRSAMHKRQLGDRRSLSSILAHYGELLYFTAQYDAARGVLREAVALSQEIGWRNNETWARLRMAQVELVDGSPRRAEEMIRIVLAITDEYKFEDDAAEAHHFLGSAAFAQGDMSAAYEHYLRAYRMMRALNEDVNLLDVAAGLARVLLEQRDLPGALQYVEPILAPLERNHGFYMMEPMLVYLTCYQVLEANQDPRAERILEDGYRTLQHHAASIDQDLVRRDYMEKIPAHRALRHAYEASLLTLPKPSFDTLLV